MAARGAGIVATERVPAVVVATKLAGARVLDESERQGLVVVEGGKSHDAYTGITHIIVGVLFIGT